MIIGFIVIIALIGLDQGLKYLAKFLIESNTNDVVWIPGVLSFKYVENTGAAWGMLDGKHIFFFIVTVVALVIFGYLFTKVNWKTKKVYSLSIVLLIAGTLGNAIDRLILGYVIDFIHVPFLTYILRIVGLSNFWFNIADLCLTLGIVLLMIDVLFLETRRDKAKETERVSCVYDTVEDQGKKDDKN